MNGTLMKKGRIVENDTEQILKLCLSKYLWVSEHIYNILIKF